MHSETCFSSVSIATSSRKASKPSEEPAGADRAAGTNFTEYFKCHFSNKYNRIVIMIIAMIIIILRVIIK
jgi:hypothetical protein